ncbi:hypothetical protein ACUNWD_01720 [Sunxiuqinia sp. A32]|uniref:hypothetical protein n=1 Tax=Sunxiuqinia sp. A32 TaxID=3461496 RepID=UPI004045E3F1
MIVLILIIAALFVLLILGTWLSNQLRKDKNEEPEKTTEVPLDCCGAHEVCDYEEMIRNPEEIIYFEDEELDRFQNILPNSYNDEQIEEFRDVLYTLQGHEIRKWLLSIQRRNIQLPSILQQEAVHLMVEN